MVVRAFALCFLCFLATALAPAAFAQTAAPTGPAPAEAKEAPKAPEPAYAALLKNAKTHVGVITLHQTGTSLYAELNAGDYGQEFAVLISIARGIGAGRVLGGMSWGFGDDWIWEFRKIEEKVHVIRKNVRFKATAGSPESSAVRNAYTDSILFSLPVTTKGPKGGDLIDLTPVFMSDLPQISMALPGFQFNPTRSTFDSVKPFKDNVEIRVAATYSSGGQAELDTVADSRGATIVVHYSVSKLAPTGYQPRLADDRIGYFLTVVKDFSKKDDRDRFVRYINRWHLEKADPAAKLSPPKKPIVFWLEKTIPFKYRKPVFDGILEWNRAFEQAGFVNAIEVRQQPDDATWDPEDINYNTFRWITSSAGFAMGPSRVNPHTGQILDADIIFDADFIQSWKQEFETFLPQSIAEMTGGSLNPADYKPGTQASHLLLHSGKGCQLATGMAQQLALGSLAVSAVGATPEQTAELQERMIMQGLKEVTMHELGHTLGLRHNFKASKWLNVGEMNDPAKAKQGIVASVMDYNPTNLAPKGKPQGDFYTSTVGPYDMWAIEYGYRPLSGGTAGEVAELNKIAARSGEPALAYATDEDTRGIDPDPDTNRFDLGRDALEFAKTRSELVEQLVPGVVERVTKEGDSYELARRAFNVLLATRGQASYYVARYIGGVHTSRSHKGDKDAAAPFAPVDVKRQRESLEFLEQNVFSDKPFQFPAELYNHLAASKWSHWGQEPSLRPDFPVHTVVLMWQERVLGLLLSPMNLERLHDSELRTPGDKDAFTTAELIERLTKAVNSEVFTLKEGEYSNRKPAISSLRRNLQRSYLRSLSLLALGQTGAPDDCQTIAYAQLVQLEAGIEQLLKKNLKLDDYSRAHLQETAARVRKVLDARLTVLEP